MKRSTKKLTTNVFIEKANSIHMNRYDYSLVDYVNNKIKVTIICNKHGEFKQKPNGHLSGNGCRKCQYDKTSKLNKFTTSDFIEKAKKIHGNRYDYSKVIYNGYESKVKIICNEHGEFKQTPHNHLGNKTNCPKCKISKGEKLVEDYLINNSIIYNREHKFENCKNLKELPFDFYLPIENLLIEFDGHQHYKPNTFFGDIEALKKQRINDRIKNEFSVENKIPLLRIPETLMELDESEVGKTINHFIKYRTV